MKETFFSWERFSLMPIVGIIRNLSLDEVIQVAPLYECAGLTTLEITMNTPNAEDMITYLRKKHSGNLNIGAGTVCTESELDLALKSGAQFIVTPVINEPVIRSCIAKKIPVFPGAFTPSEIYNAWRLGADMIKVFPATSLGPDYIRDLKGPLSQIKLLPTGGVNLDNSLHFLDAGATGLGLGNQLFVKSFIRQKNWKVLLAHFSAFVAKVREFKNSKAIDVSDASI